MEIILDKLKQLLGRSVPQHSQQATCKGCRHLLYDTNGGHWCTLFAENCSEEHQPLNGGKCYEETITNRQ